jgi:hypothetical protein
VTNQTQSQLHTRFGGLRRGTSCPASDRLSHAALGYLGVVVAASFGDIRKMWPTPQANRRKATGAVSIPTERRTADTKDGGTNARVRKELEGPLPSPATEQQSESLAALPFYNDRVVPEISNGRACQAARHSISWSRRALCRTEASS